MGKTTLEALPKRIKALKKAAAVHRQMENALHESEEKYRTLTENIAVGIFRSTPGPKGRFIEVNPAFVSMLGYRNKQELAAQEVAQIYLDPKDRSKYSRKLSTKGFVKNEELLLKRKDGTPIVVSETAIAVRNKAGKIVYFDGIVEDITERKRAEDELHIQKTYLENLFNSAPEAIALHDNNDMVVDVNTEFTKVFGYSREEAIGKPINELVATPELQQEAAMVSYQVIHGERVELETKRKRKDGTLIDVSILGAPIIDDDGRQLGDYAIYRDITERKQAMEELHIQKTYLEKLFNSAPEAIVLHDNNDIVVNVNTEFTKMFGYSREEAIGKPINTLVASAEFQDHAAMLSYQVIHGERVESDSKRKRKDGTLIDVTILGAPIIDDDGKQMGVYAIYRDITERKKAEEARIRLQEEMRMARDIQMNLLPKSNPQISGYDIAGKSIPALNVGGDYYDFIRLNAHQLALALGDVSGKGLPASLVMTNLQATVRGQTFFCADAKECMERANKLLYRSTDAHMFVSLFYGVLDIQRHTLSYANAGHNEPYLFAASQRPMPLQNRGLVLGIKENVSYTKAEIDLNPGDWLLLYSDGIPEAMNETEEEFGEEKLLEIVERHREDSASELLEKIIVAVNLHTGDVSRHDDMTIILLKRKEASH
jgi:PAS domain S-box-containing protein